MAFILNMLNSIAKFVYGWYIYDSKSFWSDLTGLIKFMDRDFGVVANIYNWKDPLYGDYTYMGRVIGPVFRTARILLGGAVYAAVIIFGVLLCAIRLILPILAVWMVILNLLAYLNINLK